MPVQLKHPPPDTAERPRDGGGSEWVELIRARHDIDAHLLVGRLQEAGVETRTMKDRAAPGAWLYGGSNPWAPVTVLVQKFQLEDARIVLAEISFDAPAADAASSQPQRPLSFATVWWITALLLGIALTVLALGQIARSESMCQLPELCEQSGIADH
jgi:hypothetical protein